MNDEEQPQDDDQEQDAHIRALLAELGSGPDGESMPPEVAARLDDTLARLVAERERPDNVVPLRRTWLPRATAAAAAIVVLGAGGVAAANLGVFGNGDNTVAGSGASSDSASSEAGGGAAATASPAPGGDSTRDGVVASGALPRLSAASFDSDVKTLLGSRAPALANPEPAAPDASAAGKSPTLENGDTSQDSTKESSKALRSRACPGPRVTDGAVLRPVRYDGRLAVLVVHPEQGGSRLVEAWDCAGDRRLAATTLTP